jgi:putative N-acetyltransferase (TIGR04045 family)
MMPEPLHLFPPPSPFLPASFQIKLAVEPWERAAAARLRRQVFCTEQRLFAGDDGDAIDRVALTLVAVSLLGVAPGDVVGTVRIHEAEPGLWWGSRLAVDRPHRRIGALGSGLIRLAVSTARARGCTRFLAHVQAANAPLFHRLHWRSLAEIDLHGHPHHHMEADLDFYPPARAPETGFMTLRRAA